jgi:hypothetical protein
METLMASTIPSSDGEALLKPLEWTPEQRAEIEQKARLTVARHAADAADARELMEALGLIDPVVALEPLSKAQRARIAKNLRRQAERALRREEGAA